MTYALKVLCGSAFVLFALGSCSDSISSPEIPDGYPTTYAPLATEKLASLNLEFVRDNPTMCWQALDEYGFVRRCFSSSGGGDTLSAPHDMVQRARDFLTKNSRFTGMTDPSDLEVLQSYERRGRYRVSFGLQWYEGLQVENTHVSVFMHAGGVNMVSGHHYPSIFIPDPGVSLSAAEGSIEGLHIEWFGFGSQRYVFIVEREHLTGTPERVVLPVETDRGMELRVVWKVGVYWEFPAPAWYVYIDTMTSEQLGVVQIFRT